MEQKTKTMKQHYTLPTLLLSLLTAVPSFGQQKPCNTRCNNYGCVIDKVECLLKQPQKDYGLILDNLDSAEGYPDSNPEQIRKLRRRVFGAIENEKNEAKRARDKAEKLSKELKEERDAHVKSLEDNISSLDKQIEYIKEKKALLNKLYFYDDKFGLAYDNESSLFGFIDKSLNIKIPFLYAQALPFNKVGLSKVKKPKLKVYLTVVGDKVEEIKKENNEFLIDTFGNEYLLSTQISLLDSTSLALDLKEIFLLEIPIKAFDFEQLKIMLLDYNFIVKIPSKIEQLKNLQILSLAYNYLTSVPSGMNKLDSLSYLYLSNNRFKTLPTEICSLKNLKYLDFESNDITTLSSDIKNLTNLTTIILENNKLTTLPAEIGQLSKLENLVLGKNQIEKLPKEVGNLTNLEYLGLENNKLRELPLEICKLSNLKTLVLNNNLLTSLPNEISNLTSLEIIHIEGNPIVKSEIEILKTILPKCEIKF